MLIISEFKILTCSHSITVYKIQNSIFEMYNYKYFGIKKYLFIKVQNIFSNSILHT